MPKENNKYRKSSTHKRGRTINSESSSGADTPAKKKASTEVDNPLPETQPIMAKQVEIPNTQPDWFADFSNSLKEMSKKLDNQTTKMDNQTAQINDLITQVKDLNHTNNFLEEKIGLVEEVAQEANTQVRELLQKIESLQKDNLVLNKTIIKAEKYSKKSKFYNIAESQRESTPQLMNKLADLLRSIDINLESIHRLPSSAPGPRPIIVKFCSYLDRDMIWNRKLLLKERNIKVFISEHFDTTTESNIRKLLPIKRAAMNLRMKTKMVGDQLTINSRTYTIDNLKDLPDTLNPANLATRTEGDFIFFFNSASPFSNFYHSHFTIDRVTYNCVEQYVQGKKAILFGDNNSAAKIMDCNTPQAMKSIGSKITNFDKTKWTENSLRIAKEAIEAKFTQNPDIKNTLLNTGTKTLVEAAPKDKTWGIGIYLHNPDIVRKEREWGHNLQGKALMAIRDSLRN